MMLTGILGRLAITPAEPARYAFEVGAGVGNDERASLPINPILGKALQIEFDGIITCCHCGTATPRSYGEGHCYDCFRRLARCDLCVVSPARCHFAAGTCREPEWGLEFCMQPHLVYLANSSGPKVGITGDGGELGRWLDQGASQGLVVARTPTRHLAGVLEERLARRIPDRTDWRALLRRDAEPVDLAMLREQLRPAPEALPEGVRWLDGEVVATLAYPVLAYPPRLVRFDLERTGTVRGRLLGAKGQYLLFEHGVLNVRRHRGFHVHVTAAEHAARDPLPPPDNSQLELFSC